MHSLWSVYYNTSLLCSAVICNKLKTDVELFTFLVFEIIILKKIAKS